MKEAVIVGIYYTNGMYDLDRIALSFKSKSKGEIYRHIVLVVKSDGKFGALGLSRRHDLMYKSMRFETLMDLINEYICSYQNNFHELVKIKVGLPVQHDPTSLERIPWQHKTITLDNEGWEKDMEKYESDLKLRTLKLRQRGHE
ncbi:Tubulinyl-Tyr carboxypeptidase 1 [Blyttiomyces sp. JEL0837]|nr:Tubulinyl-Tyr carboxypeptidase 1 [Blyttiomyces sp. JEL0837]